MAENGESLGSEILSDAVDELSRNRTWLFVVAFGVYFLAAVTLVVGILDIARYGPPADFGSAPASSAVLVTILTAVLYAVPAVMLHRFARSISDLQNHPTRKNLLVTLEHGTRFWRLVAIMLAIPLIIILLALPGSF
jgi:hypothetical protein